MNEINKAFDNLKVSSFEDNTTVYHVNDQRSVIVADRFFTIINDNGDTLDQIAISDFSRSPRAGFRRIKKAVE